MLRSIALSIVGFSAVASLHAQTMSMSDPGLKRTYWSTSGEWIFSTPVLDVKGGTPGSIVEKVNSSDQGAILRFSPFFCAQSMLNYDLSDGFGLFTGFSIRNQGFIYDVPSDSLNRRYKFRTYNVGIPVGFKVGHMNHGLVFVGYEIELPFNYKEKRFENEQKQDKFNVWFSDRNEQFFQSAFIGFQGPESVSLTIRYYLTNFHNTNYEETTNGVTTKPYAGLNENLLTFSLGYALFDGRKTVYGEMTHPDPRAMR